MEAKNGKMLFMIFGVILMNKVQNTLKLSNSEVYDYVNEAMKDYLFPK